MEGHSITVYGYDIEAYLGSRSHDLGVVCGETPQGRPFSMVDRPERGAEGRAIPALDLDEHQASTLDCDQVDFTAGQADVAGDDPVAAVR